MDKQQTGKQQTDAYNSILVERMAAIFLKYRRNISPDIAVDIAKLAPKFLEAIIDTASLQDGIFLSQANSKTIEIIREGVIAVGSANVDGSNDGQTPGTIEDKQLLIQINIGLKAAIKRAQTDIDSVESARSEASSVVPRILAGLRLRLNRFVTTKMKQRVLVGNEFGQGSQTVLGASATLDAQLAALKIDIANTRKFTNIDYTETSGQYMGDIDLVDRDNIIARVSTDLYEKIIDEEATTFHPVTDPNGITQFTITMWRGVMLIEDDRISLSPASFDGTTFLPDETATTPTAYLVYGTKAGEQNLEGGIREFTPIVSNIDESGNQSSRFVYNKWEWDVNLDAKYPELITEGALIDAPLAGVKLTKTMNKVSQILNKKSIGIKEQAKEKLAKAEEAAEQVEEAAAKAEEAAKAKAEK